jgi:hypothetical protein
VKLKDGLRQIDPDGGDCTVCCMLVHGRRSLGDPFRQRPSWHIRCRVGAVHTITEIRHRSPRLFKNARLFKQRVGYSPNSQPVLRSTKGSSRTDTVWSEP